MSGLGILWSIIIGLVAGAIAGWIMKGKGFGLIVNLIVGLAGSVIGSFVYKFLGFSTNSILGVLLMSVIGAVLLLFVVSLFKKVQS